METCVDTILKEGVSKERLDSDHRGANLEAGIRRIGNGKILQPDVKRIAAALLHRKENVGFKLLDDPERMVCNILVEINNPDPEENIILNDYLGSDERHFHISSLVAFAQGCEYLNSRAKRAEVKVDKRLSLAIFYGNSNWEGLSGLYFFAIDSEKPKEAIPLYVIRGNPIKKDGQLGFEIRTIQPWVSEDIASVRSIKEREYGLDRKEPDKLAKLDEIVRERQRLMGQLTRKMNKGKAILERKEELSEYDLVLLMALAYFQGLGVNTFWGISHKFHPEVKRGGEFDFNYDDFFQHWFTENVRDNPLHQKMYPRFLDKGSSACFIPNFANLAGTTRRVLMDIFNNS